MFLTIEDGKLTAIEDGGARVVIDTDAKLDALLTLHEDFLVSSSIDFPTEYTSDPVVLALVARIRG